MLSLKASLASTTSKRAFSFSASARRQLANLLQQIPSGTAASSRLKRVHARILVSGFRHDVFLANFLLRNYSKSDCFRYAQKLFDEMPERNFITWSTVVSMYAQKGFDEQALMAFSEFRRSSDWNASEHVLCSVVRACAQSFRVDQGRQVHGFVVKSGFDQEVYVGTSLIDFYAKCGSVEEARSVFDGLVVRTSVTWASIITTYVKAGICDASLNLFYQMRETNVVPDKYVLSSALSACAMSESIEVGRQIHAHLLRTGVEIDTLMLNVLIDFYMKCGKVNKGRRLFDRIVAKKLISWTIMISGYMKNLCDWEALELFSEMARSGNLKPDEFACTGVLTSCGSVRALNHGREVHSYTIKVNLEYNDYVQNGLIDMYAKCDSLIDARRVFDGLTDPGVISYNAMIEGYSSRENLLEAVDLFHRMRLKFLQPSLLTFVSLLGVSAAILSLKMGTQIHGLVVRCGFYTDNYVLSALVDSYSKCACTKDARLVFDEMKERDIVVWNAMLCGYVQSFENAEALKLYPHLKLSRQKPDDFTFSVLLTASSNLASLGNGQKLHNQIIKSGLDSDPFISSCLVDMYAKCGSIDEACNAFTSNIRRDLVCWNSLISSYAQHGEARKALETFERMKSEGINPSYVTFVGILSACCHGGLVKEGFLHFESMAGFGIEPGNEHYACMVSLLSLAGKLHEAKEFIAKMPLKPEASVWRSLLSACRAEGDVELGKFAADMALLSDPIDSGSYVLLSNVFASKGMWIDAKRVRQRMNSHGVVKETGQSWIELNGEIHSFVARDRVHPNSNAIFSALSCLTLQARSGLVPNHTMIMTNY